MGLEKNSVMALIDLSYKPILIANTAPDTPGIIFAIPIINPLIINIIVFILHYIFYFIYNEKN